MQKIRSIHFVGIKGVGMAPLAVIAKEAGMHITGSDISDEFITDEILAKVGIVPEVGFSKDHIKNTDLVIATGAHGGLENVEVAAAKEKNIPVLLQGEAVGFFMTGEPFDRKLEGISICGCHGKTTTTAMIATVLREAGKDPSFTIGTGNILSLGSSGHYGKGNYFVAEADEYAVEPKHKKIAKFLMQHPKIAVMTNIEFDHPDLYGSIDEVREAYQAFANQLPEDGILIAGGDDPQVKKVLSQFAGKRVTYGFGRENDYVITKIHRNADQLFFFVQSQVVSLGEFSIRVPGEHNVQNALAALIVGLECGLSLPIIKQGLMQFVGTKRRFE
ncbi:MAG: UDP-N-acetylmuramate--L-alanine ligase, partial [Candidatus Levyibacteriota bacterium]